LGRARRPCALARDCERPRKGQIVPARRRRTTAIIQDYSAIGKGNPVTRVTGGLTRIDASGCVRAETNVLRHNSEEVQSALQLISKPAKLNEYSTKIFIHIFSVSVDFCCDSRNDYHSSRRHVMLRLTWVTIVICAGLAFVPVSAVSQAHSGSSPTAGRQPLGRANTTSALFNQEAEASDPAGIRKYSEDLVELIVNNPVGVSYVHHRFRNHLAVRVARAEQAARAGNGKLVPEAAVVKAYNDLMTKIGAPPSYQANEGDLHKFRTRAIAIPVFHALFTANRNGTNCNPGEAVFLFYFLISNNGQLSENLADSMAGLQQLNKMATGPDAPSRINGRNFIELTQWPQGAEKVLFSYCSQNPHRTAALFNDMAKAFGI